MKTNTKILLINICKMRMLIFIALIALSSLNAEALAVASDYLENNTLTLAEGTSKIYSIRLQNPESYDLVVKVDYDRDFMKAIDFKEEYTMPKKSALRIEFNVTAPEYDEKKNEFVIGYTVHQSGGGGTGISFLTKINKNFKLKVAENPSKKAISNKNKPKIGNNYAVLAIIALVLLLYMLRKKLALKRKRNKPGKYLHPK